MPTSELNKLGAGLGQGLSQLGQLLLQARAQEGAERRALEQKRALMQERQRLSDQSWASRHGPQPLDPMLQQAFAGLAPGAAGPTGLEGVELPQSSQDQLLVDLLGKMAGGQEPSSYPVQVPGGGTVEFRTPGGADTALRLWNTPEEPEEPDEPSDPAIRQKRLADLHNKEMSYFNERPVWETHPTLAWVLAHGGDTRLAEAYKSRIDRDNPDYDAAWNYVMSQLNLEPEGYNIKFSGDNPRAKKHEGLWPYNTVDDSAEINELLNLIIGSLGEQAPAGGGDDEASVISRLVVNESDGTAVDPETGNVYPLTPDLRAAIGGR